MGTGRFTLQADVLPSGHFCPIVVCILVGRLPNGRFALQVSNLAVGILPYRVSILATGRSVLHLGFLPSGRLPYRGHFGQWAFCPTWRHFGKSELFFLAGGCFT